MASSRPGAAWPWGQSPYPPPLQREGECRSLGLEGRGAPWRPREWEEPGGPQWPPGVEDGGSYGVSSLEIRGRLPSKEDKEVTIWGGTDPPRESWSHEQEGWRGSWEPPRKRVRSPPMRGWLRVPLSPPREDSWEPPQKRIPSPPLGKWQSLPPSSPMGKWQRLPLSPPREDSWEPPPKRLMSPPVVRSLRVPISPPQEDSWEPPTRRVRSPPMGRWLRVPLNPPRGKGWTSPSSQRPPGTLSSHATHLTPTSSSSGRDTPKNGGTPGPGVSRDVWDGPKMESMARSRESQLPTRESFHDQEILPPTSRREMTGRNSEKSRWPEERSSSSSSGRGSSSRGDAVWETRQCNLENQSYSKESWNGRGFQSCLSQMDSREENKRGLKGQQDAHFLLQTQREVLDTMAPATALYKMAEAAMDRQEGVDHLAVCHLARCLLSSAGSTKQKSTLQRCLQILESIDPRLTPLTIGMTDLNSGSLLYAGDKERILKRVSCSFPNLPEEPLERNYDQQPQLQDKTSLQLWHRRFGHVDSSVILRLPKNLKRGIRVDRGEPNNMAKCLTCLAVKGDRPSSSLKTGSSSTALMDLIHCELSGPMNVPSLLFQRYILIFVDDYSRHCVTFLLKEISETHRCFEIYLAEVRKKHKSKPKAFQMNSAADFISPQTLALLELQGISHKRRVKLISRQSRTGEREMMSLLEMAQCMLADASLPGPFWGHAIVAATYLWNRLAVNFRKSTPIQAWGVKVPHMNHLRVFGSLVRNQLDLNDPTQNVFVAYSDSQTTYRVMNLETGMFHTKGCLDFDERQGVEKRGSFLATVERQGYGFEPFTGKSVSMTAQPEPCIMLASGETREETSMPGDEKGDEVVEADKPIEPPMPQSVPALSEQSSDQQIQLQEEASLELWHRRFGHVDSSVILRLQNENLVTGIKVDPGGGDSTARCLTCLAEKGTKPSFSLNDMESSTALLDLIHCELSGPFNVPSLKLKRYILLFVDDYSRYCVTFLLKETNEIYGSLKNYLTMLRKRHKLEPKEFQINSAADSISPKTLEFLEEQGILHKRGSECISGQSRTAKREMKSLLEMTQSMLADANLPGPFWGYAIITATYLWNLLPVSCEKRTPFQAWSGEVPCVNHLRVFGSLVYDRQEPNDTAQHILVHYHPSQTKYSVINLETGVVHTKIGTLDFDEQQGVLKKGRFLATVDKQGYNIEQLTGKSVHDPTT